MKKIKKIIFRSFLVMVGLLFLLIIATHFIDFGYSSEKISERFAKNDQSFSVDTLVFEGREVEYIRAGNPTLPMLVFVHGSPSDWTSWLSYVSNKQLLEKYQVFAFNRLGYEDNTYRLPESDLTKQAEVINNLMDALSYSGQLILIGHSYGAPVIVKYNTLYPNRVDKMVLMGASVDPELEPDQWYFKAVAKKTFRWILPEIFDISNREILPLRQELESMQPELDRIKSDVLVLHGSEDKLVPVENVAYMQKEMINANLKIKINEEAGHLFVFTNPEETIQELLLFIDL